jgi:hypothetical protein
MARARPRVPLGCRARPPPPRPATRVSRQARGAATARRRATCGCGLMAGRDLGPRLPTCLSSLAGADFGFVLRSCRLCVVTRTGRRAD